MPLLIIAAGILVLLLLTVRFKFNAFLAFILVSIGVGLGLGLSIQEVVTAIKNGMGATLGFMVLILGLGAMLGKLIADSGAAQQITNFLIDKFGRKYIQWALMLTGFIIGLPLFYSVGFVMMIPLIFTLARSTKLPLLYVGLPMLASLSVTHGYLPPHPGPTGVAELLGANLGKTLAYGILVAIPAIIVAGPIFSRTVKKIEAHPIKAFYSDPLPEDQLPTRFIGFLAALMPVFLILLGTLSEVMDLGPVTPVAHIVGDPVIAMLISVLFALFTLGLRGNRGMKEVMDSMSNSVSSITMVLLVIAGAGGLKQVLIDSQASAYIADLAADSPVHPLLLVWLIATLLRVSIGSATVAGLTAAGIAVDIAAKTGTSPELMVLAIGSGSLMLSHVNDAGFWLFKEYFNLSVKDTLRSWTVMETVIGLVGLAGVLLLDFIWI
ncbi:gluconate:H+ symporter [Aureicoccus marinus]|uniref:Gluconate transporter n=1 Tax=Aureicoccus marinus TaxID=754435 RepID=A0A2S7T9X6_9FLAO|nr:gluconate:H+ symporter [Aureicoccus marinus]PQJ16743.1 gluconate transporter [Aureicoccus marinus]